MSDAAPYSAHPTAIVESTEIGHETKIWAFAHVLPGARIGSRCVVGDHCFVESGAVVGDRVTIKNHVCIWDGVTLQDEVFVGPNVCFTNDRYPRSPRMPLVHERYTHRDNWLAPTIVEQGCTIGGNATIVAGVRLGAFSFIAAGAVVTSDVEPFALVAGCPARQIGTVCRCGFPRDSAGDEFLCPHCGTPASFFSSHPHANTLTT